MYATTAANAHESSYACYYDESRDTYLGDWYSVNWMEDSDAVGGGIFPIMSKSQLVYCSKEVIKWLFIPLGCHFIPI